MTVSRLTTKAVKDYRKKRLAEGRAESTCNRELSILRIALNLGRKSERNKIDASTPYDFGGRNLTPHGGLLPVITMLEKLGFESLVTETLTSKRIPRVMDLYRFVRA